MPRIDTTKDREKWQFVCPECESKNWRANNGVFQCRRCDARLSTLKNQTTGELVPREEIELVGPNADWKAPYPADQRGD